jgi:hypothetical protein
MNLKALLMALFVAGLVASFAVAAPPPGKGKGKEESASTATSTSTTDVQDKRKGKGKQKGEAAVTGATCKPVVTFVLKGEFVSGSADAEGAGSFVMEVKQSNAHGWHLRGEEVTVHVDAKTKIRRRGRAELSDLEVGDRLNVHVRACKKTAGEGAGTTDAAAAPKLVAKQVVAHPAKAAAEDETAASA